jgi:hypothetical protein
MNHGPHLRFFLEDRNGHFGFLLFHRFVPVSLTCLGSLFSCLAVPYFFSKVTCSIHLTHMHWVSTSSPPPSCHLPDDNENNVIVRVDHCTNHRWSWQIPLFGECRLSTQQDYLPAPSPTNECQNMPLEWCWKRILSKHIGAIFHAIE